MGERENIKTLMDIFEAFNRNDVGRAAEGLDPEVVYVIRGQASVSGTYRGREAFAGALRRIKELTGGTMRGTPEVVMASGDHIMMYLHVTGRRADGRHYDNYQAYLYRFRNGKMLEGQTIPVDARAFEEFLAG